MEAEITIGTKIKDRHLHQLSPPDVAVEKENIPARNIDISRAAIEVEENHNNSIRREIVGEWILTNEITENEDTDHITLNVPIIARRGSSSKCSSNIWHHDLAVVGSYHPKGTK